MIRQYVCSFQAKSILRSFEGKGCEYTEEACLGRWGTGSGNSVYVDVSDSREMDDDVRLST